MSKLTASPCVDPVSGLEFHELSHPWGYNAPTYPGFEDVRIERITYHAKFGVMTQRIVTVMHSSTHVNAPIHLVPMSAALGALPADIFFGNGAVLSIAKSKWQSVDARDLERAKALIRRDDIVIINTGWHKKYADSQEYFGHAPGLSLDGARWLVDHGVKLVGIDTPSIDHPLATSLGPHRNGPQIKTLAAEYERATKRKALADFPEWNAAHRYLLSHGVPTIENVGGDVDAVNGRRCTIHALPWRWTEGDACVIRLVAILDPGGTNRIEPGRDDRPRTRARR